MKSSGNGKFLLTIIYYLIGIIVIVSVCLLLTSGKKQVLPHKEKYTLDQFELHADPYDLIINVIITNDTLAALNFVDSTTDKSIIIDDFRGAEAVTFTGEGNPTMWFPLSGIKDIATINHELFHILAYAMRIANVILSESSEEAFAYELDYLSSQFFNHIKNINNE